MPSKSAKHRKALREIAISNLKKDRNFFVVGLTYGCRSRCGCKRGISVFLFSFLNSCFIVTCVMGFRLLCKNTLSDVAQAGRRRK